MKDYIVENYKRFHEYAGSIINFVYTNYLKNNSRDSSLILGNVSSENSCLEEITSGCEHIDANKKVVPLRKKRKNKHEVHKQVGIEIGCTDKTFFISYE